MNFIKYILFALLIVQSTAIQAIDFTLTERQINQIVSAQFPHQQVYQGLSLQFEKPTVSLIAKNQVVHAAFYLMITDGENILKAKLLTKSSVQYNKRKIAFDLIEPKITNFKVIENSLFNTTESLRKIKQDIAKQIPNSIGFDERVFNFGLLSAAPNRVKILDAAMLLQY